MVTLLFGAPERIQFRQGPPPPLRVYNFERHQEGHQEEMRAISCCEGRQTQAALLHHSLSTLCGPGFNCSIRGEKCGRSAAIITVETAFGYELKVL